MNKIVLIILLLFTSAQIYSQDLNSRIDSLEKKYQESQKDIQLIKFSLITGHKEFKIGTMWTLIGAAMIGTSFLSSNEDTKDALIGGGGVALLSGAVIYIHSHRLQALQTKRILKLD